MKAALLVLAAALAVAPGSVAMQGPVVCVTEPCPGPGPVPWPACIGLPCDLVNLVCQLVLQAHCVD